jgi:hypothetical protein
MFSAARTRLFLACGSALACAVLPPVGLAPALAQGQGPRSDDPSSTVPREVRELWSEYPLNQKRPPAPPSRPLPSELGDEGGISAQAEGEDRSISLVLGLAAAVASVVVAIVALVLLLGLRPARALARARPHSHLRRARWLRRPTTPRLERPEMNDFVRRVFARRRARLHYYSAAKAESIASSEAVPSARTDIPASASGRVQGRSGNLRSKTATPTPATSKADGSYAQVGEEVAAVLTSAHQAAEEIRESARQEAERIRAEANDKAESTLAEATQGAEQTRRESEKRRAEADDYSRETREAAERHVAEMRQRMEDEATKRRAEVDEQVREIRRAAEAKARNLQTEAVRRQKALIEEAGRSEARLQQLLDVFHGMTSQLEELVRAERAGESGEAEEQAAADERLDEELKPERARARPA